MEILSVIVGVYCNNKIHHNSRRCERSEAIQQFKRGF
jgi:hypothetical protein